MGTSGTSLTTGRPFDLPSSTPSTWLAWLLVACKNQKLKPPKFSSSTFPGYEKIVADVFQSIAGPDNQGVPGNKLMKLMSINRYEHLDPADSACNPPPPPPGDPAQYFFIAYMTAEASATPVVTACDIFYTNFKNLGDVNCGDLPGRATGAMYNRAAIIFHELTHWQLLTTIIGNIVDMEVLVNINGKQTEQAIYGALLGSRVCSKRYH